MNEKRPSQPKQAVGIQSPNSSFLRQLEYLGIPLKSGVSLPTVCPSQSCYFCTDVTAAGENISGTASCHGPPTLPLSPGTHFLSVTMPTPVLLVFLLAMLGFYLRTLFIVSVQ